MLGVFFCRRTRVQYGSVPACPVSRNRITRKVRIQSVQYISIIDVYIPTEYLNRARITELACSSVPWKCLPNLPRISEIAIHRHSIIVYLCGIIRSNVSCTIIFSSWLARKNRQRRIMTVTRTGSGSWLYDVCRAPWWHSKTRRHASRVTARHA